MAVIRNKKYVGGKGTNPKNFAIGVKGNIAAKETTNNTMMINGVLGLLFQGLFAVRITNTTNVWVANDSTNQPV
nr:hypothetical protein [Legionella sainthelensi]